MSWMDGARARLRLLLRRGDAEERMDEEIRFHIEMETEKNVRAGLSPAEARRRAVLAFGGVEGHREAMRDQRGLAWVPASWLDVRLALRMMAKYPGLTLVGGVGMAVAIATGAVFETAASVVHATLPLQEGERVVAIENWDTEINNQERRILHDFAAWREELRTVEELGAYRNVGRNLIVPGGPAEPMQVAEMTASGFQVARTPPLLGRHLVAEDEQPGAPPVVVIGHDVWRSRFGGDPAVVGREVRLGGAVHTVVGVMPEGFAFPTSHALWVPLRARPADFAVREGPGIQVFGRLAPGVSLAQAQAELDAYGRRAAAELPETHQRLRPRVVPYPAQMFDDMQGWEIPFFRMLLVLLLVVVCVNVAVLVYARTATRLGEIAVRSALGASRRRVVTQLFVEALALALVAAAAGLGIAWLVLRRLDALAEELGAQLGGLPFWIELRLSPSTVLYAVALAVLAAVIVGVVPALQATGRRLQDRLRALGGGTGMRLGRTWTVLIVTQIALAVAVLPSSVYFVSEFMRFGMADPGFAAEEYLTAGVVMDRESPPAAEAEAYRREFDARYGDRLAELLRRIREEPGIAGASFALTSPGHEPGAQVETDGATTGAPLAHPTRFARVDPTFFELFDVALLAGRRLGSADVGGGATAVVVNRSFARDVLGDGNAVGRHIRFREGYRAGGVMRTPSGMELGRWYEVVGVVDDFPPVPMEPGQTAAVLYHPLAPGEAAPVSLVVRARRGDPAALTARLRDIAAAVDPALQLQEVTRLDQGLRRLQGGMRMGALGIGLVTLSVLLLSAAGVYAMMSFTVAQRRKEIGIRAALGAQPGRILSSIFSRALRQLGLGAAVGLAIGILLFGASGIPEQSGAPVLAVVATIMTVVGLLAAVGPARRGLRIQPMDALREE